VSPDRVVVLRALGLGDLLTAVPALRAVRRAHPRAHLTLVGPVGPAALLPTGLVDEVRRSAPLAPLDADLAHADLAVNLHGCGPQSTRLLQRSEPRSLVSYGVTATWRPDEHEVLRWCRLVSEAGMPADPTHLDLPVPEGPAVPGAVLVHPGAAQSSRRWPVERWAEVVRELRREAPVLVTGSDAERPLAQAVVEVAGLPPCACVAGDTDALRLAALVGAARLLVSVDTGVAHLATALGTPSVVLFGPTPPQLWGPPPGRPQHRVLWAGRTGDNFADEVDPGLLELTARDVVAAAREQLSAAVSTP
jgi:ADP-heptose:LPS heptosyltransferase